MRKNANLTAINQQLLDDGISWAGIWRATVTNKKNKNYYHITFQFTEPAGDGLCLSVIAGVRHLLV